MAQNRPFLFSKDLLNWHAAIDRNLPWKNTKDPYKIWLSEIILQQTRVAQGTPYYLSFLDKFPTATDLANADETEVMKLWQGLGYYSRARNLHKAAKLIRDDFDGQFPSQYNDIINLPGIGPYTASAIVSFAFGHEYPVVDGNVIRVISRYYGITEAVDSPSTLKSIKTKVERLIKGTNPALFNQAIMDFGALHCTPKSPNCHNCPFSEDCLALRKNIVDIIPYKAKRIKRRNRFFHYLVLADTEHRSILRFRSEKDIWQSLYDFPCLENENSDPLDENTIRQFIKEEIGIKISEIGYPKKIYKHVLTHQNLFAQFYELSIPNIPKLTEPYQDISYNDLQKHPFPILLIHYFKDR